MIMSLFPRILLQLLLLVVFCRGVASSSSSEAEVVVGEPEEECVVGSNGEQICPQQPPSSDNNEQREAAVAQRPTLDQLNHNDNNDNNNEDCVDSHEQCAFWASVEECQNNPDYMLRNCPKSCGSCRVETDEQRQWSEATLPWGERQSIPNHNVLTVVQTMITYMTETVQTNATYDSIRDQCRNRHAQCAEWAAVGECQANPAYMTTNCAPVCGTCEQLDFHRRCPFDPETPKAFSNPGDVNRFFERLLDRATTENNNKNYHPVILSAPAAALERHQGDAQIITIAEEAVQRKDGPWVVSIPNFLSPAECEHLIALGAKEGYERSKDVGAQRFDGTFDALENPRRTSTNAWCNKDCYEDPVTQELTQRLEPLTGIPANNSEFWQLLKYEEGQEYMEHHDWIDYQLDRAEGVRILTVFFYLNTVAEDGGGGTHFPRLDLTVQPLLGSALIWPSTLDENPDAKDPRTNHQAMPVLKGIKYGANAWIHQRDYKTPHDQGCT